jgi:hypothetical protein
MRQGGDSRRSLAATLTRLRLREPSVYEQAVAAARLAVARVVLAVAERRAAADATSPGLNPERAPSRCRDLEAIPLRADRPIRRTPVDARRPRGRSPRLGDTALKAAPQTKDDPERPNS